jgi:hypothetical protein
MHQYTHTHTHTGPIECCTCAWLSSEEHRQRGVHMHKYTHTHTHTGPIECCTCAWLSSEGHRRRDVHMHKYICTHTQVRSNAAHALGSLVKSMDDEAYSQLETYLLYTMKSDASMVERSGAAQGLGEVSLFYVCVHDTYIHTVLHAYTVDEQKILYITDMPVHAHTHTHTHTHTHGAPPIARFENVLSEIILPCSAHTHTHTHNQTHTDARSCPHRSFRECTRRNSVAMRRSPGAYQRGLLHFARLLAKYYE